MTAPTLASIPGQLEFVQAEPGQVQLAGKNETYRDTTPSTAYATAVGSVYARVGAVTFNSNTDWEGQDHLQRDFACRETTCYSPAVPCSGDCPTTSYSHGVACSEDHPTISCSPAVQCSGDHPTIRVATPYQHLYPSHWKRISEARRGFPSSWKSMIRVAVTPPSLRESLSRKSLP